MIKDDGSQYIDLAVEGGLITHKQATMLREELFMFPGQNARNLMVKRGWITGEQAQQLEFTISVPEPGFGDLDDDLILPPAPTQQAPTFKTPSPDRPAPVPYQSMSTPSPDRITPLAPPPSFPPTPAPEGTWLNDNIDQRPAVPAPKRETNKPKLRPIPSGGGLVDYLRIAREAGCSDLHLVVGRPPFVRFKGLLHFFDEEPLTSERSEKLNFAQLTDAQRAVLNEHQQLDFALELEGLGRHRCNIFKQRLGWEGVYRIIPGSVPSLTDLNMPPVLARLTEYNQGLVLVTGPAGCGKTTTVAAMLDHINRSRADHIITVEDPVEYIIPPVNCQVTQREVGRHTQSFANALRGALRQDPDIIMVGDLRDLETTSIAISAAETGHLVFGTLHTSSALRTVARVMDVYPPGQRAQICTMIAESLRGIITQQLIQRRDGNGLALAMEILIFTPGVAQLIKEGKPHQLVTLMQSGKRLGMQSMDDALMELAQQGIISGREAYSRAENKPLFESIRNQD